VRAKAQLTAEANERIWVKAFFMKNVKPVLDVGAADAKTTRDPLKPFYANTLSKPRLFLSTDLELGNAFGTRDDEKEFGSRGRGSGV
jgi:hypothetical protein